MRPCSPLICELCVASGKSACNYARFPLTWVDVGLLPFICCTRTFAVVAYFSLTFPWTPHKSRIFRVSLWTCLSQAQKDRRPSPVSSQPSPATDNRPRTDPNKWHLYSCVGCQLDVTTAAPPPPTHTHTPPRSQTIDCSWQRRYLLIK